MPKKRRPTPDKSTLPPHPGTILNQMLEEHHINARQLSDAIGVDPMRVHRILRRTYGVTADTAIRLGLYFGTEPMHWLILQATRDLAEASKSKGEAIRSRVVPMVEQKT